MSEIAATLRALKDAYEKALADRNAATDDKQYTKTTNRLAVAEVAYQRALVNNADTLIAAAEEVVRLREAIGRMDHDEHDRVGHQCRKCALAAVRGDVEPGGLSE